MDNIAVYTRCASVCAIRIGFQTQACPPWSSVPKFSITGTSSAARPGLPSHEHSSVPSVSRTQVCTFRLTDTGLYHTSLAHPSLASVVAFPFGDLHLGLLFQGQQSDHPSWLSDSGTSGSTFRLRDIGLHYPFRRTVLAVRLVAISVGISLGDIRLCLQSQDRLISFNPHSKGSSTNYYRLINFNRTH